MLVVHILFYFCFLYYRKWHPLKPPSSKIKNLGARKTAASLMKGWCEARLAGTDDTAIALKERREWGKYAN